MQAHLQYILQAYTNATSNIQESQQSWSATRAESPSDSYIQISAQGEAAQNTLAVGSNASVFIKTTKIVPSLRILVRCAVLFKTKIDDANI